MPSAPGPIVVTVDFSPDSEAAFEWAVHAAIDFGAPLLVLHVVHDPAAAPGFYARSADDGAELEEVATRMMTEYIAQMRQKLPEMVTLPGFGSRVVVGLPVGRILEVVEHEGARMIVMGGRGRTRPADVLLGSKVERVARLARVPVTIVRAPDAAATAEPAG